MVLSRILESLQKLLRGLKRQKLFAISGLVYTLVFLALNVYQIVYLNTGIVGLFYSAIIANAVSIGIIILMEPKFRINPFKLFDFALIKRFWTNPVERLIIKYNK